MDGRRGLSGDGMELPKDRRVVVLAGMGLALFAGLAIALLMIAGRRGDAGGEAPPASQGGLVVQTGRDDDIKLDPRRPLRCFVDGKLAGELTVSDCARRNGVASGALDVGLDPSGALAASNGASSHITPLPPAPVAAAAGTADAPPEADGAGISQSAAVAACWRYGDAEWTRAPEDMTLSACVKGLYADECDTAGPPVYGRWGDRTLRLLAGRVEISPDNRYFRVLAARNPGCPPPSPG
jgi:hypothetical protein